MCLIYHGSRSLIVHASKERFHDPLHLLTTLKMSTVILHDFKPIKREARLWMIARHIINTTTIRSDSLTTSPQGPVMGFIFTRACSAANNRGNTFLGVVCLLTPFRRLSLSLFGEEKQALKCTTLDMHLYFLMEGIERKVHHGMKNGGKCRCSVQIIFRTRAKVGSAISQHLIAGSCNQFTHLTVCA